MRNQFKTLVVLGILSSGFPHVSTAQTTFIKANNATALNLQGSYTANSGIPSASDTIAVNNTLTAGRTVNLGGNLSISAFTYNSTWNFTVGATANAVLTIGSGGITKSGGGIWTLNNAIALSANQTWTVTEGSAGNLLIGGSFNDAGYALDITGNGTIDFRGNNTFSSLVTIGSNNVNINSNSTITFQGTNTFRVFPRLCSSVKSIFWSENPFSAINCRGCSNQKMLVFWNRA